MPRGRKQLTDKQERILVQCQLMGLTTADLVTISNRLKALDAEREFRARVNEATSGFSWTVKNKREFTITDGAGHVYEVKCYSDYSNRSWTNCGSDYAKITVSKPGTRFKTRTVSDHKITNPWNDIEIVSACPEGSKYLYRVLRDIKNGRFA
jgi:hypothetical protein